MKEKVMFREDYSEYRSREKKYKENKRRLFGLLHGQCTPTLISGVKSQLRCTERYKRKDIMWLINTMKKLSGGLDDNIEN